MEPREFMFIWLISIVLFVGLLHVWDHRKGKKTAKPAPVTHQATPSLITDKWVYVESLEGNRLQKRNRSV